MERAELGEQEVRDTITLMGEVLKRRSAVAFTGVPSNPVDDVEVNDMSDELLECVSELEAPGKKFRFQGQRLFLTYPGHVVKDEWERWLRGKYGKFPIAMIVIAHEVGVKNGAPYPHSHMFVDFGQIINVTNVRAFDYPGHPHPHLKKIVVGRWKPIGLLLKYISKEDPALRDLHEKYREYKATVADIVWSAETEMDAVRLAQTPAEVPGIKMLWAMKAKEGVPSAFEERLQEQDSVFLSLKLHPWQERLIKMLYTKPDPQNRKVYWFYDLMGNAGKTTFLEILQARDRAEGRNRMLDFTHFGGMGNAADFLRRKIAAGWEAWAVLVDLARSFEDKDIYGCLECIKNGKINATKYECDLVRFPRPHVVVFANFPPKTSMLSPDRWAIVNITPRIGPSGRRDPSATDAVEESFCGNIIFESDDVVAGSSGL